MKKFILGAVAAAALAGSFAGTADAAPWQHRETTVVRHHGNQTTVVRRDSYNGWRKGQRFDYRRAPNYTVIRDYHAYRGRHLYAPPRGYRWVRSGNDAVLVAITGGLIGAVLSGAFN